MGATLEQVGEYLGVDPRVLMKAVALEFSVLVVCLDCGPHHDSIRQDGVIIGVEAGGNVPCLSQFLPINHRKSESQMPNLLLLRKCRCGPIRHLY